MKILFLDLASHEGTVACVEDNRVSALVPVDHRVNDAELPGLIEDVLKKSNWEMKDLTHLACVIGPGGFTSLRVGVSAINALAFALGIPATGIHLSDLYAVRAEVSALWLHSTKKIQLFLRDLAAAGSEPHLVSLEELPSLLSGAKTWTGELIPEHRAVVDPAGLVSAELRTLADVLPEFLAKQTYDSRILQPWYGRGW